MGIFGAGIATALSYILIGTMRMRTVKKDFDLRIDYKRMLSSILVLCVLTATMILTEHSFYYIISVLLTALVIYINHNMLADILRMLSNLAKNIIKKRV